MLALLCWEVDCTDHGGMEKVQFKYTTPHMDYKENLHRKKLVLQASVQGRLSAILLKMVMRMRTVGAAVVATLWLQYYVSFLGVCAQLTADPPSPESSLPWKDIPIAPLPSLSAPECEDISLNPDHD